MIATEDSWGQSKNPREMGAEMIDFDGFLL